jgi:membrane protein DedA with SNARE-associated domain
MPDFLKDYITWAADAVMTVTLANAEWAPLIIFMLAFAESLAVISLVVPSTVILIGLGAVIQIGGIPIIPMIVAAVIGAFLGDWVSYMVGHWFKTPLLRSWPLNTMQDSVARAERLFQKYGWVAYFFGRFVGPLRAVFPLFAGMTGMRFAIFQAVNAASAICWASLVLGGGLLLGESFKAIKDWL